MPATEWYSVDLALCLIPTRRRDAEYFLGTINIDATPIIN